MKQGEVWLIDLDPTKGAEIQKKRPAIIVSDDSLGKLPLKVIVPVTDWKDRYSIAPWMVSVESSVENGLVKKSAADCFQIRSISDERLIRRLGIVEDKILSEIKNGILSVLNV